MNKLGIAALVALTASSVLAVPGSVKSATDQIKGDVKWQRGSQKYIVTYKKGKTMVNAEFPRDEVEINITKPANLDKLIDLVKRGQATAAITGLTAIVKEYKMLTWDRVAGRWLVEAYLATNNAKKAYDAARDVIEEDKSGESTWKGELAPAYWQALLKTGQNTKLENCLNKAAASGDRAASAAALVMRGDMILDSMGDTPDAHRKALTDAYLRVALMYGDEPCRDARAQALQKAAHSFDKLGMAARAEAMRSQAKTL